MEGLPVAAANAAAASPKPLYQVHVDHLHRPIMLTDAARANVWWASYEPFGRVRATGGALTQNLQLPGQWLQLETGLAYNWHRHYDPSTGRYTTPDPLGFVDGPSVFAYARGGPDLDFDPDGLMRGGRGPNASGTGYAEAVRRELGHPQSGRFYPPNGGYRVPDSLNPTHLREYKNTSYLSRSCQLQDYAS